MICAFLISCGGSVVTIEEMFGCWYGNILGIFLYITRILFDLPFNPVFYADYLGISFFNCTDECGCLSDLASYETAACMVLKVQTPPLPSTKELLSPTHQLNEIDVCKAVDIILMRLNL